MRWLSTIFLASVWMATTVSGAEVYYAHGYHGGYFLTDERAYSRALDDVFGLLETAPDYKVLWELEPYTLERMAGGEQFACERRGRTEAELAWWALSPRSAASSAFRSQDAARACQWGLRLVLDEKRPYVHGCQPLPAAQLRGRRLAFSGWVRAGAAGQAHLYVDAHGDRGVIAGSAHLSALASADGQWHQRTLEFTVPDGARVIFPQTKIVRGPGEADFDDLSLRDIQGGSELLANGGFEEMYLPDLVTGHVPSASWPALRATTGNRFTTLADYFRRLGQPKETWEDPYKDFEHRFPWGLLAGRPQRDDRVAENAVLQTERLFAIANRDAGAGLDDAWVCAPTIFGIWNRGYTTYAELTHEADREALAACSQLQSALLKTPGRSFVIVNTSSAARRAVAPISCVLPAGLARSPMICDTAGRSVPASFTVVSRHDDRSVREIGGTALVEIPPLGYRRYEIREGVPPPLPTAQGETRGKQIVLTNSMLSVTVGPDGLVQVSDAKGNPFLAAPAFLAGEFPEGQRRSTVQSVHLGREGVDLVGRVGIVLGYGGPFLYAPGHAAPLRGPERFEFRLLFREGDLASAWLPEAADTLAHPLLVSGDLDAFPQPEFSLVKVEPAEAAIITAAYLEKKSLVVRLWRPWPGDETVRLKIVPARRTVLTNLLGQPQSRLVEGPECSLPMHLNQVITLRGEL